MSRVATKSPEKGHAARIETAKAETVNAPETHAHDAVMSLQREAGNRAVSTLVEGSSGRPLDPGTRGEMEAKFGADFGNVRIHSDEKAAGAALSTGARAITTGQDIAFGSGFYDPASGTGKRLLAHELAHVVQQGQRGGRKFSRAAAEGEARQAGADVAAGRAASVAS